jgi:hypothetical protein
MELFIVAIVIGIAMASIEGAYRFIKKRRK